MNKDDFEAFIERKMVLVDRWIKSQEEAFEQLEEQAGDIQKEGSEKIRALKDREAFLRKEVENQKKRAAELREIEGMKSDTLEALGVERDEILDENLALNDKNKDLLARLNERREELSEREDALISQVEGLREQICLYERWLGMKFEVVPTETGKILRVVFTQVSAKEPSKEFIVELAIDKGIGLYTLYKVEPSIKVEVSEALVKKLNKNSDMTEFLKRIRRAFQTSRN